MSYFAEASIARAKQDLGYHEGPGSWNPYSLWQGLNPYNPWCASFACFAAYEGGGFRFPANSTFGAKGEAYTPTMKTRAQEQGYWRDKHWRAAPGDFVEYDWGNNGLIDHVEIVVADDGNRLVTIGGNVSNSVAYRTRDRAYVAGFVALSESDQVAAPPPPPPKVRPMFDPALQERARLRHPEGKGWWIGLTGGRVDWLPSTSDQTLTGGMLSTNDRKHFQGRTLARLEHRPYMKDGEQKHGYTIVATSEERYVPEAQS